MDKKFIKLLDNQINKLGSEDFDLEAWKASTVALLKKCFGDTDPKIQQIEKLKIDYSSWALRDSNSSYKPVESCKKIGREVLQTAIEEIEFPENVEQAIPLEDFFSEKDVLALMDNHVSEKQKLGIIKKLNKSQLEQLVLCLFPAE